MKYTVYHGTNAIFDEFKNEYTGQGNDQIGSGFYFTDNPDVAYGYGKNILKCEIEIDNPIRLSQNDYNLDDADIDMSVEDVIKILVRCPNLKDEEESPLLDWMDVSDIEWDYVEEYLDGIAQTYVGRLISLEADFFKGYSTEFRKAVNEVLGYDGVIQEFKDGTFYVCWFPEQIKILGSVNENAQKEIVYHCSNKTFDKFDKQMIGTSSDDGIWGRGFYFGNQPNTSYGKNIYRCEITMNNPFIVNNFKTIEEIADYLDVWEDNFYIPSYEDNGLIHFSQAQLRQITSHIIGKGHDGIIVNLSPQWTEYIVFNPEQIKILGKEINENAEVLEKPEIIDKSNEKFWRWFNGSKCVNEKGEPLVVYHGTDHKIKSFNRAKIGKKELNIMSLLGFHFTPDYNMARTLFTKTGNVLECYLSIKNPYIAKESEIVKDCLRLAKKNGKISEKVKLNKLLNMEYWDNDGGLVNQLYLDAHKAEIGGTPLINYQEIAKDYLKYLKSQGYDGVKYLNEIEWAQDNRYDWIAFEPNQIKSVNAKEFSNSSNIYEELNKEIEQYL